MARTQRSPELLVNWRAGALEFTSGNYWDAHECWERGWRTLGEPDKSYVQGLIQAAGAIYLAEKGRATPAGNLARRALEKLALEDQIQSPKLVAPDLTAKLQALLRALESEGSEDFLKSFKVQAHVLE